jgi:hypothetical protein
MRWGPAKPRQPIKVVECGRGHWDERDHGLDIPHEIQTTDFKITGTDHRRIERMFNDCCAERRIYAAGLSDTVAEQRIAKWLCLNACSFVLFDTKARATVIGFVHDEDADAFRREFIGET